MGLNLGFAAFLLEYRQSHFTLEPHARLAQCNLAVVACASLKRGWVDDESDHNVRYGGCDMHHSKIGAVLLTVAVVADVFRRPRTRGPKRFGKQPARLAAEIVVASVSNYHLAKSRA
jgi:hypothetical protein